MSHNTNIINLMTQAREAMVTGNNQAARSILRQVTRLEPNNYRAWLWLAGISDAPSASLQYAKRAHEIAPNEPRVQQALSWANSRMQDVSAEPPDVERVVAAPKAPTEAEIEEVKKRDDNWLKRLGLN